MHHRGKQFQLADDPLKGADLLFGGLLFSDFGFKSGCAPAQVSDPRLELGLFDQALGIAVDQAVDRAASFSELAGESIAFELTGMSLDRVETSLIFLYDERGVFQQPTDLGPDRLIERLNRDQSSIASDLAVEPAAIGTATAVVAPLPSVVMTREPVPALLADEQAAQQVLDASQPLPIAVSVLLQPFCGTREEVFADDG